MHPGKDGLALFFKKLDVYSINICERCRHTYSFPEVFYRRYIMPKSRNRIESTLFVGTESSICFLTYVSKS
jgi:hypothetical protein